MSPTGSKILPFPVLRRSEQTGIIQRNFPARWLALLLMGSVGAAYAFTPGSEPNVLTPPALVPSSQTVMEGDAAVVSQLAGSLMGSGALSSLDRELLEEGKGRRVVLEVQAPETDPVALRRERADFSRVVEELEGAYMTGGQYPAVPAAGSGGPVMSYRTDGEDFTLSAGNRSYSTETGMTYEALPAEGGVLQVKAFLQPGTSGWGPWEEDTVSLVRAAKPAEAKAAAVEESSFEGLAFLEGLPQGERGTARMFFPVNRSTCGHLFHRVNGSTAYSSGELTYDATSGSFSLKLFRSGEAPAAANLNAKALDTQLQSRDLATTLVGESALLSDLGLMSPAKQGEDVMLLSTAAVLPGSVSSALDGLRLASLDRHREPLSTGPLAAGAEGGGEATMVGRVQLQDKLGQLHQLRLRGGRGANYDWLVGQVCPLPEETRIASFVDSQAASYQQETPVERQVVKAGR